MTDFVIGGIVCGIPFGLVCAIIGYTLRGHINTANAANSGITRALTIPGGDVAALNAKMAGLGDQLQKSTQLLAQHITGTATATAPAAAATVPPVPIAPSPAA